MFIRFFFDTTGAKKKFAKRNAGNVSPRARGDRPFAGGSRKTFEKVLSKLLKQPDKPQITPKAYGQQTLSICFSVSIKYRHAAKTSKKAGIFFVLAFVGVLSTTEGENGKSKILWGYLDDIPIKQKAMNFYFLCFYFLSFAVARLFRHAEKTSKKAGIFFVLAFVGVLSTTEGKNGKSKILWGYIDDIPIQQKAMFFYFLCFYFLSLAVARLFRRSEAYGQQTLSICFFFIQILQPYP